MTETKQHTLQHIPTSHNADFGAIWDERRKTLLRGQDQKPHRPDKMSFHVHKTLRIMPDVTLTSVVAVDIPPAYPASPCVPHPLPISKNFAQHPMTRSSREFYSYNFVRRYLPQTPPGYPGTRRSAVHTTSPLIHECIPEPPISRPSTPLMLSWDPLVICKVRIVIPPFSHTPIPSTDMSAMLQDINDFSDWIQDFTHPEKEGELDTLSVSSTESVSYPHTLKSLDKNVGSSTSTLACPSPHHQSPVTSPVVIQPPCSYRSISNVSSSPRARRVFFKSSRSNTSSVPQTTSSYRSAPIEKSSPRLMSLHSGMISFKTFFQRSLSR